MASERVEALTAKIADLVRLTHEVGRELIDLIDADELIAEPDTPSNYQHIGIWRPFRLDVAPYGNNYQAGISNAEWAADLGGAWDQSVGSAHLLNTLDWDRQHYVCAALWKSMWRQVGRDPKRYAEHIEHVRASPFARDAAEIMTEAREAAEAERNAR